MKLYKHYKNGKLYEIVDRCMIQENNEWIEAVIYRRYTYDMKFCRSVKEFEEKFKLVESINSMQKYKGLYDICMNKIEDLLNEELRNRL